MLFSCSVGYRASTSEPLFRQFHDGVLGSTHGKGPMLILPTAALWALLERALRREAKGAAGSSTFREQMLTSRQMPCRQAETLEPGACRNAR